MTFFNPATGLCPRRDWRTGARRDISIREPATQRTMTGAGAHTTVLVPPAQLYVISPKHGGILVLADALKRSRADVQTGRT